MQPGSSINWIAAYNRLFLLLDRSGTATYYSGPSFLRMVQQIDPGSPNYEQLTPLRQSQGKSTSRKSFYWDVSGNRAAFLPTSSAGGDRIEADWPRSVASTALG